MKMFTLNKAQWLEFVDSVSGWTEKMSVGMMVIGVFQEENRFAGLAGGLALFFVSTVLKLWRKRNG